MADWGQTQRHQTARVTSSLGDKLLLVGFTAAERLSEPFTFFLDVLAKEEVDFIPHLGAAFGVDITEEARLARAFNGVLFEAAEAGDDDEGVRYRLTLRPWTLLLDTGLNTRLFQDKSVPDIIKDLLVKAGFSGYEFRLQGSYQPRHYCVQYRESDFAFISRLMEEEGIYYYFEHQAGSHKLVLCDAPSAHRPVSGLGEVEFTPEGGEAGQLLSWGERVRPGVQKVSLRDSHFMKPFDNYAGEATTAGQGANDKAELYDYPGGYAYEDDLGGRRDGAKIAKRLLEASRAERRLMRGSGHAFALAAGHRVKVTGHPHGPYNEDVLIVGAVHNYAGQVYRSGGGGGAEMRVALEATPLATPWRPLQRTPKPVVRGPQTAVVVGPDEAKGIYVDKYGRVRVQFYWDRQDESGGGRVKPDNRSCWVRVSQGWADGGFGAMHIPRVGEEVIVSFLEGDPDRPIVTGRVYNAERMPPYELPAEKTKSTWKSQTVGDSGPYPETEEPPPSNKKGFNELRFEDKGGSEEVYIHAQRDLNQWVRHNESRKTGRDVTIRVGHDRTTKIKRHETKTVEDGDETHTVEKGKRTTTVKMDETLVVQTGHRSTTVETGNESNTVKMGNKTTTVEMGNYDNTLKMGNFTLKCNLGKVTVEAMQAIELKVGMSSVVIDQTGVTVKGMMIKSEAQAMNTVKAPMTDVKGDAMLMCKGGLVMIN